MTYIVVSRDIMKAHEAMHRLQVLGDYVIVHDMEEAKEFLEDFTFNTIPRVIIVGQAKRQNKSIDSRKK